VFQHFAAYDQVKASIDKGYLDDVGRCKAPDAPAVLTQPIMEVQPFACCLQVLQVFVRTDHANPVLSVSGTGMTARSAADVQDTVAGPDGQA
jgi:hypothetical protein